MCTTVFGDMGMHSSLVPTGPSLTLWYTLLELDRRELHHFACLKNRLCMMVSSRRCYSILRRREDRSSR